MKRYISLFLSLLCVAACSSLAGCGKKKTAEVYFLNFKPESASVYEELAKKYEDEKGVKVKVVTAAANNYEQTLKSEIAKSSAPTIFQVNGPIGYNSWKDYCLDIKDSKLYDILSDKSLAIKEGDGVYAVPYVVEGYGIIYNNAVMKKYFALPNKKTDLKSAGEIDSFDTVSYTHLDVYKRQALSASFTLYSGSFVETAILIILMPPLSVLSVQTVILLKMCIRDSYKRVNRPYFAAVIRLSRTVAVKQCNQFFGVKEFIRNFPRKFFLYRVIVFILLKPYPYRYGEA